VFVWKRYVVNFRSGEVAFKFIFQPIDGLNFTREGPKPLKL